MEILKVQVIRGPNYWSIRRQKLIVITLDLAEYNNVLTTQIPEFNHRLKKLIPSLYEHRCSEGVEGGFFIRLHEGTLLGHVLEHVALEIQNLAGMDCSFGRVRETHQVGIFKVVFSYQYEEAGILAGKMAFQIVKTLAEQTDYSGFEMDIESLIKTRKKLCLGPSTESILEEAAARDIPYINLNDSLTMLGQGRYQKLFSATLGYNTSGLGVDIVSDKKLTKSLLDFECIPTPKGCLLNSIEDLKEAIEEIGFPLVIKPRYGNHGKGITTNVTSLESAIFAYSRALEVSNFIMAEKFIEGDDYRFLLINYKLVAAAKRTPPFIIGDGIKTVKQLIDAINLNPLRGYGHENVLTQILINETTIDILKEQSLTLDDILPAEQKVVLSHTANISSGGTAADITDIVYEDNKSLAERVARIVNLDICGVDMIIKDITKSVYPANGAVLEVNAAPGFRMHLFPTIGEKINVAKPFLDMLFPAGSTARVPLIAVTGTNGKTTVVRLITYIAEQAGYKVGMTTTEGIYINKKQIYQGDCSGPKSAQVVLRDPTIDFAVLECARGGILRSGLGFDKCTVSIVTNISEDHLGQEDIYTLDELARVKLVVPQSTAKDGYAILNAEDDVVYSFKDKVQCKIALFALNKNKRMKDHIKNNGLGCFIEKGDIVIVDQGEYIRLMYITEIPITLSGIAECMIKNILPAILAVWISGIDLSVIVSSLKKFLPNARDLPGRMNIFKFSHCQVMVDYAHNEEAYLSLSQFLATVKAKRKIAVIAGTGDRRDSDILKTGYYAAMNFDEIIIRFDKDSRGRTNQEITDLLISGIKAYDQEKTYKIIPDEFEAISSTIANAPKNSFIWHFPDDILSSIKFIKQFSYSFKRKIHYET